jgi:hypothetical protein
VNTEKVGRPFDGLRRDDDGSKKRGCWDSTITVFRYIDWWPCTGLPKNEGEGWVQCSRKCSVDIDLWSQVSVLPSTPA